MTPELMTFSCSNCSKEIKVAKDQNPIGKQLVCSGCNAVVTLSEALLKKPLTLLTFACTLCGRHAQVQETPGIFGKQMKCKACHNVFTLDEETLVPEDAEPVVLGQAAPTVQTAPLVPAAPPAPAAPSGADQESVLDDDDEVPREFSGYKILRLLGKGAMGRVYEAFDSSRNQNVALKVMVSELQHDEKNAQRFLREAKATMKVNNPNIVNVYDVGSVNNMYYFTMEIIKGTTLESVIKEKLHPLQRQVYIITKVLYAVGTAHSQGIIHRDLKPSNIMVDEQGEPKVMDFGLAKLTEDVNTLTKSGDVLGTIDYMSPEQAAGLVHEIDHRADLYTLGVILYEILTGKIPFKSKMPLKQLLDIAKKMPKPPHEMNEIVPKELSDVCMKALAKAKDDRFQHAGEFIDAIQPILPTLPN